MFSNNVQILSEHKNQNHWRKKRFGDMLVREWKQKTIKHDKYTVYQWHMRSHSEQIL